MRILLAVCVLFAAGAVAQDDPATRAVREVVERFEKALEQRDLAAIEPLMDPGMVAFENGHRNDSWADFRDNHLKPEMQEPAPPMERKLMRVTAGGGLAWAYSRATFTNARGRAYELWSVYVLSKQQDNWKIVMLDWSMRALPAAQTSAAQRTDGLWTLAKIEDALKKAGFHVRRDVAVEQPYLKTPGRVLLIGKEPPEAEIQVYLYDSMNARKADSERLDPRKAAPPTVSPHWLMPVSLIAESNFTAIVLTRDKALAEQIRAVLTKPAP